MSLSNQRAGRRRGFFVRLSTIRFFTQGGRLLSYKKDGLEKNAYIIFRVLAGYFFSDDKW